MEGGGRGVLKKIKFVGNLSAYGPYLIQSKKVGTSLQAFVRDKGVPKQRESDL